MEWWKYTFSKTIFHFESQIMCLQKSILSQIKSNSTKNKIKIIKRKKMINKIKWKTNNQNNWNKGTEKKTKAKNQTKLRVKSCSYMKVSHRVSCAWIQYRSTRRSGVVFISLIASSVKHYLSPMKNQEKTQIRRIQSSDKTTAFSKQSKISLLINECEFIVWNYTINKMWINSDMLLS